MENQENDSPNRHIEILNAGRDAPVAERASRMVGRDSPIAARDFSRGGTRFSRAAARVVARPASFTEMLARSYGAGFRFSLASARSLAPSPRCSGRAGPNSHASLPITGRTIRCSLCALRSSLGAVRSSHRGMRSSLRATRLSLGVARFSRGPRGVRPSFYYCVAGLLKVRVRLRPCRWSPGGCPRA